MKKKHELIPAFFWGLLGIFVMVNAYKVGLGNFINAGPGLMPFLLGICLFLVSMLLIGKFVFGVKEENGTPKGISPMRMDLKKISLVSLSLFAYALLLKTLGFLFLTSLLLLFLFRIAGSQKWRVVVFASVITILITYFVFTSLGLRFPKGIFGY
jgi:hypothetical protein